MLTRKLRHPNAVSVEDIDESDDGQPFIVMEYIDGLGLKQAMEAAGPMPAVRVCSLVKQVAWALDAAHKIGIVHRDIKPDNIIIVPVDEPPGETVKVLDFGIAKIKEEITASSVMSLTGTGMAIGTPPYMSPEQALGKRGDELDGRSDIYSLGVVMYQMLTGELPIKGDTPMQVVVGQIHAPPVPIRDARPGLQIADEIADLVMNCLEKDRELRPRTAVSLIEAIEHWEQQTSRIERERAAQHERLRGEIKAGRDLIQGHKLPEAMEHLEKLRREFPDDDELRELLLQAKSEMEAEVREKAIQRLLAAAIELSNVQDFDGAADLVRRGLAEHGQQPPLALALENITRLRVDWEHEVAMRRALDSAEILRSEGLFRQALDRLNAFTVDHGKTRDVEELCGRIEAEWAEYKRSGDVENLIRQARAHVDFRKRSGRHRNS